MFCEARRHVKPQSGTEWLSVDGVYTVFSGVESPVTQTFGLGILHEASDGLTPAVLDTIEDFFFSRGTAAVHEVSPFAGVAALDLLCESQYRPVEISSVLYQPATPREFPVRTGVTARVAKEVEIAAWVDVLARGWLHEYPEQREFISENGAVSAACQGSVRFLAELNGEPGAAGTLFVHDRVALFGGAATVPAMRRHGLQTALIEARIQYAAAHGCDLLMLVAEAGSESQRNAERNGFRVAYTRTKWRKSCPGNSSAK